MILRRHLLFVIGVIFVFEAFGQKKVESAVYEELKDFDGKLIGIQTGTEFDKIVEENINNPHFQYFPTGTDCMLALAKKKVDAVVNDRIALQNLAQNFSDIEILDFSLNSEDFGYVFRKDSQIYDRFNQALKKLKEEGKVQQIITKWSSGPESEQEMPEQTWEGSNGTLTVATECLFPPITFLKNNIPSGFENEILLLVAKEMDMKVKFIQMNFDAILPYLATEKADLGAGGFSISEERKQAYNFSENYFATSTAIAVRKDHKKSEATVISGEENGTATSENSGSAIFAGLKKSFYKNFILESRWKLLLGGLKITTIISIFSLIFGVIAGFGLCMFKRANKVSDKVASGFIRLIQGMPTLVLLMILYYIIFGAINVSGVIVAIIGFSINFAAYSSVIMCAGIDSVKKGQIEAAYALGYSKVQTFVKIVFPQAAVNFIPVLKGEFISMVKMTSIVGYIAVSDLTKASDIIRSRTMEAFFPLIMTAVIYFALAWLLTQTLVILEKRIDPKRRKNILEGIEVKGAGQK